MELLAAWKSAPKEVRKKKNEPWQWSHSWFTLSLFILFGFCYIITSKFFVLTFFPEATLRGPPSDTIEAALFSAVAMSGIVNVVHAGTLWSSADVFGTRQATQDATVSSLMLALMYLRKLCGHGFTLTDADGLPIDPMHYILWACSAPGVGAIPVQIAGLKERFMWRARLGAFFCLLFAMAALPFSMKGFYSCMALSTIAMCVSLAAQAKAFKALYHSPILGKEHQGWVLATAVLTCTCWTGFPIAWALERWVFAPHSLATEVAYSIVDIAAKVLSTTVLLSGFVQRMDRARCVQAMNKFGSASELVSSLNAAVAARQAVLRFILHEIRVPLNGIAIATDIIQDHFKENASDHTVRSSLRACQTNMAQITSILNDSLDVERVEAGKLKLNAKPIPMDLLFTECLSSFPESDVTLSAMLCQGSPLRVHSDNGRLLQVLRNLLSNALKFAPKNSTVVLQGEAVMVSKQVMAVQERIIVKDFLAASTQDLIPVPGKALPPRLPAWTKIAAKSHDLTALVSSDQNALEELVKDELQHATAVYDGSTAFKGRWDLHTEAQSNSPKFPSSLDSESSIRHRRAARGEGATVSTYIPKEDATSSEPFILSQDLNDSSIEVLKLSIRDEGCGMKLGELKQLFHPFAQPKKSTISGSGLGLLISRVLVTLLGGRLGVTSAPGIGTSFFILLPMDQNEARVPSTVASAAPFFRAALGQALGDGTRFSPSFSEESSTSSRGESSQRDIAYLTPVNESHASSEGGKDSEVEHKVGGNLRVMIVDDALETRKLLRMLLKRLKCRVSVAVDGIDCLNQLESDSLYDAVILDHEMPNMTGAEAAAKIRARFPDIYVVGLTGHSYEEDRNEFLDSGANLVFSKPIRKAAIEEILATLRRLREKSPSDS